MVAESPSNADESHCNSKVALNDPSRVREWLAAHHPKQLALLDKFELELRLGSGTGNSADRRIVTARTVNLCKRLIGSCSSWETPAQLLTLLQGVGRELQATREPAISNVIRRILGAVRDEVTNRATAPAAKSAGGAARSLESMLWALPQHVKPGRGQRSESVSTAADALGSGGGSGSRKSKADALPPAFHQPRPHLKQFVMEAITEITADLEDLHKVICDQATIHIHADEIILTYGRSRTVEMFLKAAAEKKRNFTVVVCEGPSLEGHGLAKSLANDAGIETCVIPDAAMFAMMARVHKVLLPAHAVLANGGLVAPVGCNLVALAARQMAVPVVCLTGLFKLTPKFPHEGQDTLNDLTSPAHTSTPLDYAERTRRPDLYEDMTLVNPVYDYIRPELIDLYVTNVGSFQPSYIYRLLAEYYHADDWDAF